MSNITKTRAEARYPSIQMVYKRPQDINALIHNDHDIVDLPFDRFNKELILLHLVRAKKDLLEKSTRVPGFQDFIKGWLDISDTWRRSDHRYRRIHDNIMIGAMILTKPYGEETYKEFRLRTVKAIVTAAVLATRESLYKGLVGAEALDIIPLLENALFAECKELHNKICRKGMYPTWKTETQLAFPELLYWDYDRAAEPTAAVIDINRGYLKELGYDEKCPPPCIEGYPEGNKNARLIPGYPYHEANIFEHYFCFEINRATGTIQSSVIFARSITNLNIGEYYKQMAYLQEVGYHAVINNNNDIFDYGKEARAGTLDANKIMKKPRHILGGDNPPVPFTKRVSLHDLHQEKKEGVGTDTLSNLRGSGNNAHILPLNKTGDMTNMNTVFDNSGLAALATPIGTGRSSHRQQTNPNNRELYDKIRNAPYGIIRYLREKLGYDSKSELFSNLHAVTQELYDEAVADVKKRRAEYEACITNSVQQNSFSNNEGAERIYEARYNRIPKLGLPNNIPAHPCKATDSEIEEAIGKFRPNSRAHVPSYDYFVGGFDMSAVTVKEMLEYVYKRTPGRLYMDDRPYDFIFALHLGRAVLTTNAQRYVEYFNVNKTTDDNYIEIPPMVTKEEYDALLAKLTAEDQHVPEPTVVEEKPVVKESSVEDLSQLSININPGDSSPKTHKSKQRTEPYAMGDDEFPLSKPDEAALAETVKDGGSVVSFGYGVGDQRVSVSCKTFVDNPASTYSNTLEEETARREKEMVVNRNRLASVLGEMDSFIEARKEQLVPENDLIPLCDLRGRATEKPINVNADDLAKVYEAYKAKGFYKLFHDKAALPYPSPERLVKDDLVRPEYLTPYLGINIEEDYGVLLDKDEAHDFMQGDILCDQYGAPYVETGQPISQHYRPYLKQGIEFGEQVLSPRSLDILRERVRPDIDYIHPAREVVVDVEGHFVHASEDIAYYMTLKDTDDGFFNRCFSVNPDSGRKWYDERAFLIDNHLKPMHPKLREIAKRYDAKKLERINQCIQTKGANPIVEISTEVCTRHSWLSTKKHCELWPNDCDVLGAYMLLEPLKYVNVGKDHSIAFDSFVNDGMVAHKGAELPKLALDIHAILDVVNDNLGTEAHKRLLQRLKNAFANRIQRLRIGAEDQETLRSLHHIWVDASIDTLKKCGKQFSFTIPKSFVEHQPAPIPGYTIHLDPTPSVAEGPIIKERPMSEEQRELTSMMLEHAETPDPFEDVPRLRVKTAQGHEAVLNDREAVRYAGVTPAERTLGKFDNGRGEILTGSKYDVTEQYADPSSIRYADEVTDDTSTPVKKEASSATLLPDEFTQVDTIEQQLQSKAEWAARNGFSNVQDDRKTPSKEGTAERGVKPPLTDDYLIQEINNIINKAKADNYSEAHCGHLDMVISTAEKFAIDNPHLSEFLNAYSDYYFSITLDKDNPHLCPTQEQLDTLNPFKTVRHDRPKVEDSAYVSGFDSDIPSHGILPTLDQSEPTIAEPDPVVEQTNTVKEKPTVVMGEDGYQYHTIEGVDAEVVMEMFLEYINSKKENVPFSVICTMLYHQLKYPIEAYDERLRVLDGHLSRSRRSKAILPPLRDEKPKGPRKSFKPTDDTISKEIANNLKEHGKRKSVAAVESEPVSNTVDTTASKANVVVDDTPSTTRLGAEEVKALRGLIKNFSEVNLTDLIETSVAKAIEQKISAQPTVDTIDRAEETDPEVLGASLPGGASAKLKPIEKELVAAKTAPIENEEVLREVIAEELTNSTGLPTIDAGNFASLVTSARMEREWVELPARIVVGTTSEKHFGQAEHEGLVTELEGMTLSGKLDKLRALHEEGKLPKFLKRLVLRLEKDMIVQLREIFEIDIKPSKLKLLEKECINLLRKIICDNMIGKYLIAYDTYIEQLNTTFIPNDEGFATPDEIYKATGVTVQYVTNKELIDESDEEDSDVITPEKSSTVVQYSEDDELGDLDFLAEDDLRISQEVNKAIKLSNEGEEIADETYIESDVSQANEPLPAHFTECQHVDHVATTIPYALSVTSDIGVDLGGLPDYKYIQVNGAGDTTARLAKVMIDHASLYRKSYHAYVIVDDENNAYQIQPILGNEDTFAIRLNNDFWRT